VPIAAASAPLLVILPLLLWPSSGRGQATVPPPPNEPEVTGTTKESSSAAAPAAAPEPTREGSATASETERLGELVKARTDALGRACAVQAVYVIGDRRYLACGDAGIWVLSVTPGDATQGVNVALLAQQDLGGFVRGFFMQGGYLWAEVSSVRAQRMGPIAGGELHRMQGASEAPAPVAKAPAPAGAAPAVPARSIGAPSHRRTTGTVIETGPGYVVVSLGRDDGLRPGHHLAFYDADEPVSGSLSPVRSRRVAIGLVDSVSMSHARVVLGTRERVAKGARAHHTVEPLTASSVAPPRVSDVWEIGFVARPFLILDDLGGGVVSDAWIGKRYEAPFHLEARVAPFAVGAGEAGTTVPTAAFLTASYDAKLFEVGLGLGAETVHDPAFDLEVGSGLSVVQMVRLGARDGLNLTVRTHVVLFHSEFEFSSVQMQAQIPFGGETWLIAGGGGGSVGAGYGELGLRALLTGNGDRDSFFLTAVVGGVNVFEQDNFSSRIDYTGPMVGIGGEWRF